MYEGVIPYPLEEPLFLRDQNGQIIKDTPGDQKTLNIEVDGVRITAPAYYQVRQEDGSPVYDHHGHPQRRSLTILEAIKHHFKDEKPLPVLCHRDHLNPAAVCRVCLVQTTDKKTNKSEMKPACRTIIREGMKIDTIHSPNQEPRKKCLETARGVVELLLSDHAPDQSHQWNELNRIAQQLGARPERWVRTAPSHGSDKSSPLFELNHDACVLCDRCIRSCHEVSKFHILGRADRGANTRIAFDLDRKASESNCTKCGECVIACPTDALSFRRSVSIPTTDSKAKILTYDDIKHLPFLGALPAKFLDFNPGSLRRRVFEPGAVLCRQGDYGETCFLIEEGTVEIRMVEPPNVSPRPRGWLQRLLGNVRPEDFGSVEAERSTNHLVGEMNLLSHRPRTASMLAKTRVQAVEITENALRMAIRDRNASEWVMKLYGNHTENDVIRMCELFSFLPSSVRKLCEKTFAEHTTLRAFKDEVIIQQGEPADSWYVVRRGTVVVEQVRDSWLQLVDYLMPGRHFGEIALLSHPDLNILQPSDLPTGMKPGLRTSTCKARGNVEVLRVDKAAFDQLASLSQEFRQSIRDAALDYLDHNKEKWASSQMRQNPG